MMQPIEGVMLNESGMIFAPGTKVADLLYHEGPLLSMYKQKDLPDASNFTISSSFYFCKWTDCDDECNRWLYVQVTPIDTALFFLKKTSLRDLLAKSPVLFLVDIDRQLSVSQIILTTARYLPPDYLPGGQAFFNETDYTTSAIAFSKKFLGDHYYSLLDEEFSRLVNLASQISYYHSDNPDDLQRLKAHIEHIRQDME